MNDDRDPFAGPAAVGPLGQAMRRLTDDAPEAGFSEWTIRGRYENRRAERRQVLGGVAAGVAAIGLLAVLITTVARGGSGSATTAAGTSSAAAPSTAATSSAASAAAGAPAGGTRGGAAGSADAAVDSGADSEESPGGTGSSGGAGGSTASESCPAVPLTDARLRAVQDTIPGLDPIGTCADSSVLAAQWYAVAGGELHVSVRSGEYDPCAATACADVPGHPGVRSAAAESGGTQVWTSRDGVSYVLTAIPADILGVDVLATAAEALADAGG